MTTVTPLSVDVHCPRCGEGWQASVGKPLRHTCVESDPVVEVWTAYVASLGQRKRYPKLTLTRRALITRRLGEYPKDDVVAAVQGWQFSPFHCGQNDEARAWNALEVVLAVSHLRNNLEKFRDLWLDFGPDRLHAAIYEHGKWRDRDTGQAVEIDFTHIADPSINSPRFMAR